MNRRHAIRSVEIDRKKPILIEQRIIRVLVLVAGLLLAWPMIAADKYVCSARYKQARYIESVDAGIWVLALFLQVAWVTVFLLIAMRLSTGGG